jgi:hypothetical protein
MKRFVGLGLISCALLVATSAQAYRVKAAHPPTVEGDALEAWNCNMKTGYGHEPDLRKSKWMLDDVKTWSADRLKAALDYGDAHGIDIYCAVPHTQVTVRAGSSSVAQTSAINATQAVQEFLDHPDAISAHMAGEALNEAASDSVLYGPH